MKEPKEIYLLKGKADGELGVAWHDHYIDSTTCNNIKYIRADLAELTWKDIRVICERFMDAGLLSELPARSKEFYKEVLRRFLESKKEIKL